ncbi:MAG: hypothetical protein J6X24_02705 [Firmicutes bacterium]|nr:hypothetical protein [Bacillota bacterium]
MKKTVVLLALALVLVLAFAGCKKEEPAPTEPVFTLNSEESKITAIGDGANQGVGGVGYLSFGEGEYLNYQLSGEDSKEVLKVTVFYKEEDENPLAYTKPDDSEKVYMSFTVENGTGGQIEMEPGDYALLIEVDSLAFHGTAIFEVASE